MSITFSFLIYTVLFLVTLNCRLRVPENEVTVAIISFGTEGVNVQHIQIILGTVLSYVFDIREVEK